MKLYNAFAEPGFHTTIATTFAIDFAAYEQLTLARLWEAGCMNHIVVADSRMLTYALEDAERPPLQAGRRYSLVGAEALGLFHPKLVLQLGADCARLIVASANLTASGLAGNLEVVGELRMDPGDDDYAQLMRESLAFIESFIPPAEQGARKQLEWARARAPWLQHAEVALGPLATRLLVSGPGAGIGQRFVELVGGEPVTRMIAVSPYWDEGLAAVRFLQGALRPRHTALVIQPDRGLFPGAAGIKADIYDARPLIKPRDRFAHAKVLIVQTKKADHVLFGSPNCTIAALGAGGKAGVNVEASLYKRMASGAALEALGLGQVLDGHTLGEADVAPYARAADIPLEQLASRQPGRFQVRGKQLTWTPAPAFDVPDVTLELLDAHQQLQLANPPSVGQPSLRVYQLEVDEAPRFARVRAGDRVSAVGVVHIEEMILENLRAPKTKRIQDGLDKLAGGDIEGLFLYEALELIDGEERRIAASSVRDGPGARGRPQPAAAGTPSLSYDEFVRGRASGPSPDMTPGNSLASSHVNEVRALLNTLIGVEESRLATQDSGDSILAMPLGLGDETADGEQALEEGGDLGSPPPAPPGAEGTTPTPAPATRAQDTEDAIVDAVARFNKRIADAAEQRALTTRDLLRVRVLLTILIASGSAQLVRRVPSGPRSLSDFHWTKKDCSNFGQIRCATRQKLSCKCREHINFCLVARLVDSSPTGS
jgi:hypothetical protein